MSHLDDFLAHNIDGYLTYDLTTMSRNDANGKGVGYPILMSTYAGIEFLGTLLSAQTFDGNVKGYVYFGEYWKKWLYPPPSPFGGYGDATYQLVRHGIAHSFVLKGMIGVLRHDSAQHFTRNSDGVLVIDATRLSTDFLHSYATRVKPILTDPSRAALRASMEAQLGRMEAEYASQAVTHGVVLTTAPLAQPVSHVPHSAAPSGASAPGSSAPHSAASGSSGPLGPGP